MIATREIKRCEKEGSFQPYIPYGKLGYGKTAWSIEIALELRYINQIKKALKEVGRTRWKTVNEPYNTMEELRNKGHDEYPLKDEVLQYMKETLFFRPLDILNRLDWLSDNDLKTLVIISDDAGAHLSSMEWYEPYIKAFGEFMDLARTQLTSIIFTAPQPNRIARKIRTIPGTTIVRIVRRSGQGPPYDRWYRTARYMRYWFSPGFNKEGYSGKDFDYFNCQIPDFIFEWYVPMRKKYVDVLRQRVRNEFMKVVKKEKTKKEKK